MTATAEERRPAASPPRSPATSFVLPPELAASDPPEARGIARDGVRLLVAADGHVQHAAFRDLGRYLRPGDLLVVNSSATLPSAVDGWSDAGRGPVTVHVSTSAPDGSTVVEVRRPGGSGPVIDASTGERVRLPGDATVELLGGYPDAGVDRGSRLWRARLSSGAASVSDYLHAYGRPSATATCGAGGRWRATSLCSPAIRAVQRWPAPAGRSPTAS